MIKKYLLTFLIGFLSCAVLFYAFSFFGTEIPLVKGLASYNDSAPADWVGEGDIELYGDRIVLNIANASISRYAATGSMRPVFDAGANGIRVVPSSEKDISVGDIVSFRSFSNLIVHRVVEIGEDEKGVYFITKGDNNVVDDGRIRFEDIEYVTVGVIW